MKTQYAKVALVVALLGPTTAGMMHAKGRTKNVIQRTVKGSKEVVRNARGVAEGQVKNALSAVAQGADHLIYPALCYVLGKHVYDKHVQQHLGTTPEAYANLEKQVPYANQTRYYLTRVVAGSLVVAGAHKLLNTNAVGGFVSENMPRLSRLLSHVGTEAGLRNKKVACI
jgi:hypothetical protein